MFKALFIAIFLLLQFAHTKAQDLANPSDTLFFYFKPCNDRLGKEITAKLDSVAHLLTRDTSLGIHIIGPNEHLHTACSKKQWEILPNMVNYLIKQRVTYNKIYAAYLLPVQSRRIAIIIGKWMNLEPPLPHPNIRVKGVASGS